MLLEAKIRNEKVKAKNLRRLKKLPAVFYGAGAPTLSLELDYKEFRKVYKTAGESAILDLKIGDKIYNVLIHDLQFDPITDEISHVDFINVAMDKPIDTEVPFEFVGIAPAVKDLGGVLSQQKQFLRVRCLPKDLPRSITVDISVLATFHDSIHVENLILPNGVKSLDDPKLTVITVVPPKKEEESTAPLPTAAEVTGAVAPETPEAGTKTGDSGEKSSKTEKSASKYN